jgi:Protein of unknown function (DUF2931)
MKNYLITLGLLLTLTSSCQDKKQQKTQQTMTTINNGLEINYKPTTSCPSGYPIEVYRGGLEIEGGGFQPLNFGTETGGNHWGEAGSSMSEATSVPKKIKLIYLSYAEDCLWKIDVEIPQADRDKMKKYFAEGYQESMWFLNRKQFKLETYNYVVTGFAPGGAVFLWLAGSDKQVEIGRYQAEKTTVPQAEIDRLDNHDRLLFDPVDRKRTMDNPKIVPPEIAAAHKGKPIPFGLWDTYRKRYSWRPTFVSSQEEWSMIYCSLQTFNGENECLFDQSLVKNEITKRAIPKLINFAWRDKTGQNYSGTFWFNEKEIFDAYDAIYKDKPDGEAEIEIQISMGNIDITAFIKGNGKEIGINDKTKVELFKSRKKY